MMERAMISKVSSQRGLVNYGGSPANDMHYDFRAPFYCARVYLL